MQKIFNALACLALGCLLTACSSFLYKPDVQQGNIFTQEQVEKLRIGMTKSQVLYIMGSPVLENIYSLNRWDYVYTFQHHNSKTLVKRVSLTFKGDELIKID